MRKHLALTAFVCLFAGPAMAQTTTATGTGVGVSESNSGAVAIARGGNNLTINNPANTTSSATIDQRVSGSQTIKSNPSLAMGLTAAGLETCLGSASGMISLAGFGLGGGSTMTDEGCQARLDARTLASFGLKAAAVARLCQRGDIYASMPDICERYRPVAPGGPVPLVMSSSPMDVIDGRTGITRSCDNYNAARQKCLQWTGEPPAIPRKRKVAAMAPHKMTGSQAIEAAISPSKSVAPKAAVKPAAEPAAEPSTTTTTTKEN